MKKFILFFAINLIAIAAFSQFVYKIKADSMLITNDSCSAELNLENSTKTVNGFLYNKGNGRTEFRRGAIKLSDSTYIIGADTIKTGASSVRTLDTVANYTSMRNYSGLANVLVLTDSRSGGIFMSVSAGSENGATVIVSSNGRKWKRIFDELHFRPEWYEIKGKDRNGASFDRTTGTGIGSEAEAIKNIVLLAGPGAEIDYMPNKIYDIDVYIPQKNRQKHNGGYLKRAAPVVTRLSNSEAINSTAIEVVDTTGFRVGMMFAVKAAGTIGAFNDNSTANTGLDFHMITGISAGTLTISSVKPIKRAMAAGDTVISVTPLVYRENGNVGSSDSDLHIVFNDMIFDGNKVQNRHFVDCQVNATIQNYGYINADNCRFINTPGENIFTIGGQINNCIAQNLEGSFIHWGNFQQIMDSIYLGLTVENLVADSIGLGDASKQGISDGILATCNTRSSNSKWINCRVKYGGGAGPRKMLWGQHQTDDGIVQVIGGDYTKCSGIMYLVGLDSTSAKGERLIIQDAKFNNCGTITISGLDIRKGNGINGITIRNNEFINTRFYFGEVANLDFVNNKVISDSASYVRWDESRANGTGTTSLWGGGLQGKLFMITAPSDRLRITGNTFQGFDNDTIQAGIMITLSDSVYRKDQGGMTDYYYCQDVDFSRNVISGFRYATTFGITSFAKATVGWRMDGNTIDLASYTRFAADYVYGLQIPPGAVAEGGTYTGHHASNYSWPVMVYGVKSTGNYAKIEGGKLVGGTIKGKSNYGIYVDPMNTGPYNTVVMNNTLYAGSIVYSANATTYLLEYSGNKVLTNSAMNNYQTPKKKKVGEDKTLY